MTTNWLADTRISYDTVATSYVEYVRDALARAPHVRSAVATFAELVRATDAGPVADVGCGPGLITARLRDLGVPAFGIDLSPGMVDVAQRECPGPHWAVGSMTALPLADASLAGLLAWFSLIHVPDDEIPVALGQFRRVLRPGGVLLIGFHVGDVSRLKTHGYGGLPMQIHVHRRRPERMTALLHDAGFTVEAETVLDPAADVPAALQFARPRP